jgi:ABC-type multidrug transport system permease subunit
MSVLNTEGINNSRNSADGNNSEKSADSPTTLITAEATQQRIQGLIEGWSKSPENQSVVQSITTDNKYTHGISAIANSKKSSMMKSTFWAQFTFLLSRSSKNAMRNPLIVKAKFMQTVVIALIMGVLYTGTGTDLGFSGSQNRGGMLFFSTVNNVMSSTIGVLSIFGEEKIVFTREYGAGYYSMPPYFAAKVMVELPFHIVFPWVFSTIVYWMVGLQNAADKYFIFVVFVVLSSCSGFSLGIAIASAYSNLETALAMGPLILMPLMVSVEGSLIFITTV